MVVYVGVTNANPERINSLAYNKLSTYKTAWTEADKGVGVISTKTKLVRWSEGMAILNSDGWQTVTSKRKMNRASHQFGLGFGVYQRDHVWYVDTPQGATVEYFDGMEINRKAN